MGITDIDFILAHFGNSILSTKRMNAKAIFLGVSLIVTLIAVNIHGTAFAGDSLNSINPNFKDDQSSSRSDSPTQKQPTNPVGKAIGKFACSSALGLADKAVGDMIVPGVGGLVLSGVGSNLY